MERRNTKTKQVGNGEGSLYRSEKLNCWIFQYYDTSGKRQTIRQRKKENVKDFKARVTEIKSQLNTGTYIKRQDKTIKSIIEEYIKQKFNDGITKGSSYKRDKETLATMERCCKNLITIPIQDVTLADIQLSKEDMKRYAQSTIDKMWRQLSKAFSISSSPSVRLIPINIMNDENLKKPISNKKTKKIIPLSKEERDKLQSILDIEEYEHPYRDIVKLEWITAMRIGETLARSKDDISNGKLHIHNTLTEDENGKTILGEHTKTYNKRTHIDEGERFFPIYPNSELEKLLDKLLKNKLTNIYNLLFWDYNNSTFVSDKEINSWLKRLNDKYQISSKPLHNHRLRHDRITQWKEAGMDIKAIQYLVGHVEDSGITDVYIDISQEYAFKELKKAN